MTLFHRRADRPMSCREVGRVLQRYLDHDLDDLTAQRILDHLHDCRRCGLEAAAYAEIKASLARRGDAVRDDAVRRLRAFGEQLLSQPPAATDDLPDEPTGA